MENGWYFPSSYEAWRDSQGKSSGIVENDKVDDLLSEYLLVSQPVEQPEKPKKKKKKKKPDHYETFRDKYKLKEEVIGRGANSLVTLATENKSGKDYAVKIIEKYEGYDRGRVLREIDLLHFLGECPNIIHLFDSYEDTERFYLIFERMNGGPLLDHIQKKKVFTEREASLVLKDIATALQFLHSKGIAHRDLKPENILCVHEEEIVPVVICDFNLASGISIIESVTTPELYTPVGSAEYMAPEIVDAFVGDAPCYDKKCDIWSLGVILYIMLSGQAPFQGNCGESCDWDRGGSCRDCQSLLWHSILDADYNFQGEAWINVSLEAKDLISHLLVKEAPKRYTIESVLAHPWLEMASNNELSTPDMLSNASYTNRLSAVTSEAIAYRRIISERQNSSDWSEQPVISRWSTPPKFGLSPPGNSKLAKRRSLKNQRNSLSINLQKLTNEEYSDSPNNTPIQSPDIGFLIEKDLKLRLQLNSTAEIKNVLEKLNHNQLNGLLIHNNSNDLDKTPVSTPRSERSGTLS